MREKVGERERESSKMVLPQFTRRARPFSNNQEQHIHIKKPNKANHPFEILIC